MTPQHRRWFLPETPDVLGMLRAQADVTRDGMQAFARWARGEADAGDAVRAAEHAADTTKRELITSVRAAFTTPLDPEDIFELSYGLDEVLNGAKNTIREAEALSVSADDETGRMCDLLALGVARLRDAFYALGTDDEAANDAAAAAVKAQRDLERAYRHAMGRLIAFDDLRVVLGRQEFYRRLARISDQIILVADRVQYATVKEA